MSNIKIARPWRLYVAGSRRKHWLDNIFFDSLVTNTEDKNNLSPRFHDFVVNYGGPDICEEQLMTIDELKTYCSKIQKLQYWSPGGRGENFVKSIIETIKDYSGDRKCYLRMITESELVLLEARRRRIQEYQMNKQYPCAYCGQPGQAEVSPWGLPCITTLCRRHYYLMFFDSSFFTIIVIFIISFMCVLIAAGKMGLAVAVAISCVLIFARKFPWFLRF